MQRDDRANLTPVIAARNARAVLYEVTSAGANDDGTAWEFHKDAEGGYVPVQTRCLTVHLLRDGQRAFAVGRELVVDEELATELEQLASDLVGLRREVTVIGPQPKLEPRPSMIQIVPREYVHLSRASIVVENGRTSYRRPFVLDAAQASHPSICRIEQNGVTLLSEAVKNLLLLREPTLAFESVRFENEPSPIEEPAQPKPIPSREQILRATRK